MKRLCLLLLFAGTACLSWANGDPVAQFSALTLSNHPVGRHIPEIRLNDEHLMILGKGKYTRYKVTYTLSNNSDKDFQHIDYGFPIDWYGNHPLEWGDRDYYSECCQLFGWDDGFVKNVHFSIDGKELAWNRSETDILKPAQTKEGLCAGYGPNLTDEQKDSIFWSLIEDEKVAYPEDLHDLCRRWYYTSFDFAPHQQRTLTIEYSVISNYVQPLYQLFSPFKNARTEEPRPHYQFECTSQVLYDFSPASYWGNGEADQMTVILRLTGFQNSEAVAISDLLGDDFWATKFKKKTENSPYWVARLTHFPLATAPNLRFSYRYQNKNVHEDLSLLRDIRIPASRYTLVANGQQTQVLSDNDLTTACELMPDSDNRVHIRIDTKQAEEISGIIIYYGDGAFNRFRPYSILVMEGDDLILGRHEWIVRYTESRKLPVPCLHKPVSDQSRQELTDAAERIPIYYNFEEHNEPRHFTISLTPVEHARLFISEIILLGKTPEWERYDKFAAQWQISDEAE